MNYRVYSSAGNKKTVRRAGIPNWKRDLGGFGKYSPFPFESKVGSHLQIRIQGQELLMQGTRQAEMCCKKILHMRQMDRTKMRLGDAVRVFGKGSIQEIFSHLKNKDVFIIYIKIANLSKHCCRAFNS